MKTRNREMSKKPAAIQDQKTVAREINEFKEKVRYLLRSTDDPYTQVALAPSEEPKGEGKQDS